MSRQIAELRTWALIAVSFLLGILCSEFIDYRWQMSQDLATSVVSSDVAPAAAQP